MVTNNPITITNIQLGKPDTEICIKTISQLHLYTLIKKKTMLYKLSKCVCVYEYIYYISNIYAYIYTSEKATIISVLTRYMPTSLGRSWVQAQAGSYQSPS